MRIAKWGNSLAVRLPKKLIDEMDLREGDEIVVVPAGEKRCLIEKPDRAAKFLEAMKQFCFPLPPGYRFDRDEANER